MNWHFLENLELNIDITTETLLLVKTHSTPHQGFIFVGNRPSLHWLEAKLMLLLPPTTTTTYRQQQEYYYYVCQGEYCFESMSKQEQQQVKVCLLLLPLNYSLCFLHIYSKFLHHNYYVLQGRCRYLDSVIGVLN